MDLPARGRADDPPLDDIDIDRVVDEAIDLAAERVVRAMRDFQSVPVRSQESAIVAARLLRRVDDLNAMVMEGLEQSHRAPANNGGRRRSQERKRD